jgi:nucleoside-diphosphate-sugar epimerase
MGRNVAKRSTMNSLITGGAGFIGSHLLEALLERGEYVTVLDDLSTGSVENVRHLRTLPRVHCVFESMMNRSLLSELVDDADVVYHLAAAVGVRRIIESPVRTIETNVKGTELVLECAAKKNKPVFVASTSEVYGKNSRVPFREEDDICLGASSRSRWSYATSKLLDEFLALAFWHEKKLPVVVGRLFNTVGPRQTGRYGMVLPTFIRQALEGAPITVFGSGKQSRCFGYVGDAVEAIIRLMSCESAVGQVVNIGNDDEITIEDLAHLVRQSTGSPSPIHFQSYEEAYEPGFEDMHRRVPCVEKLVALTGFRPTTPLNNILDRVIAFMKKEGAAHQAHASLDGPHLQHG